MRSGHHHGDGSRSGAQTLLKSHSLARVIETDLLPRLMQEHGLAESQDEPRPADARICASAIEELAQFAADDNVEALSERFRQILAGASDMPVLFLDLLAPAARLLGGWGEDGRISFEAVDRGVKSLEQVVQMFNRDTLPQASRGWRSGSILLSALPNDSHTFGLKMVEELFRRDGWSLTTLPAPKKGDIVAEVSRNFFHVLGLSVGGLNTAQRGAELIAEIRAAALNPEMKIVIGGPAISAGEVNADSFGADQAALDGPSAIEIIRQFLPK